MWVRGANNSFQTEIRLADILVLLLVGSSFAFAFRSLVSHQPFSYDESDYMYATSKGFFASYTDNPSVSTFEFVTIGMRDGLHSNTWRGLSDYIRRRDDIAFYRHFHAPLYFYYLQFVRTFWGAKESVVRWASLLTLILTAVVVYLGSLIVARERFVGLLAIGFLLLSPTSVETGRWVSPHALYAAFAMGALFCLSKLIQTKNLPWLYSALVFLSLAFLTIEYAPLVMIVLLITVFVCRRDLFRNWSPKDLVRFSVKCIAIPVLIIGAFWPAAIYKLGLAKNYGFFLYFATIRSQTYGNESLGRVWWTRIASSPLEYVLLLVFSGYVLYLLVHRHQFFFLLPFFLYALLIFLTTVRNHSERLYYLSSLVVCLDFLSAFGLSLILKQVRPRPRYAAAALILLALAMNNFWFYYRIEVKKPPVDSVSAVLDVLREKGLGSQHLLAPQKYIPAIHYYYHGADPIGYSDGSRMEEIAHRIQQGSSFEGIIYEGSDYKTLQAILERHWSVHVVIRADSGKLEKTIVYYRLMPISPALLKSNTGHFRSVRWLSEDVITKRCGRARIGSSTSHGFQCTVAHYLT